MLGDQMQLAVQMKRLLLGFVFVSATAIILWFVYVEPTAPQVVDAFEIPEVKTFASEMPIEEPFWKQLLPKTSVQKRDEVRTSRQQELATMIGDLYGVHRATVVLSRDKGNSIGQARQQTTACVTVVPTNEFLPHETVNAIRELVAGATLGLEPTEVTVINNRTGSVCTDASTGEGFSIDTIALQHQIENSLGLIVATVSVQMERPSEDTLHIPWRNELQPSIQITLPNSWLMRRSEQVGNTQTVLSSIERIVQRIVPSAQCRISIIQDSPHVPVTVPTAESYAKQIALFIGLVAMLLSGVVVDRRRKPSAAVRSDRAVHPRKEAARILQM
ncbi:MAG TPA: hypothetical protein EYO32_01745, partial [Rhodospirillales bacterium]|nr:hypothetical protein [Rhodospirillales bacterium]